MMDLATAYLYLSSPVKLEDIHKGTFPNMIQAGWYRDHRASNKFQILNKRFNIEGSWYRVLVRFELQSDSFYELSSPVPFVITETEKKDSPSEFRDIFVDKKSYHGRKLKHVFGFINAGVPIALIDAVIQDLKQYIVYK
ncbi:MAG: hypothetical protein IJ880_04745 [Bacilli bacterium]|nr:hypothetical protein [Bacilli bacterium]MBR3119730.1 hypothetical protein [Oceanobacillus sp.]